jgi:hypothetical protein
MAPRKTKEKQLPAKTKGNAVAAKESMNSLMVQDSQQSTGFENMGADDLAIPFIVILQSNSPQCKKGPEKIPGAEEGDFYNTVTREVFKAEIKIVPCAYQKAYVEWVPRNQGGGFVRQHQDESILNQTTRIEDDNGRRDVLPNGNIVVTTAYHYCLLVKEDGDIERVVLSFTSTQLKKSRRWNTQMLNRKIEVNGKKITPAMYSQIYTMATVEESNDQGSWCGWDITDPVTIEEPELYITARKFHTDVTKGNVRTAPPPESTGSSETAEVVNDEEECF